ncbi:hypothetical protein I4F81_010272 [Pyropia yezoensis]|uniref:Uncharacterized protein n=1 Tax=Pyropia yezoensis TaxID=2788 RepID=A0ACC3CC55_PYRYE|nr:hypothetical protein I4F81_010272 [Neopyropia yezoensis]
MAAFASPATWATAAISLGAASLGRRPWCNGDRAAAVPPVRRRRRVVPVATSGAPSARDAGPEHALWPRPAPPTVEAGAVKTYWIHPLSNEVATAALEAGFSTLVFESAAEAAPFRQLARFDALLLLPEAEQKGGLYRMTADQGAVTGPADGVSRGERLGAHLGRIDTPERQAEAMSLAGREPMVVMDTTRHADDEAARAAAATGATAALDRPWWIIPAENILAAYAQSSTTLVAVAGCPDDAATLLATLEVGVAGVILRTACAGDVAALAALRDRAEGAAIEDLQSAVVTSIRTVGVGDRVCVDTASLLRADEGLLVGSASQALFLVLSEAAACAYVPSRPFRVNAGPVHSYVLTPGGRTRYLSDLRAGDEVCIVDARGRVRTATVGRVKTERRPLVLAGVELGGVPRSVLLQNAETVRLGAMPAAKAARSEGVSDFSAGVAVSALAVGDVVAIRSDTFARHVGMAIEETIMEA